MADGTSGRAKLDQPLLKLTVGRNSCAGSRPSNMVYETDARAQLLRLAGIQFRETGPRACLPHTALRSVRPHGYLWWFWFNPHPPSYVCDIRLRETAHRNTNSNQATKTATFGGGAHSCSAFCDSTASIGLVHGTCIRIPRLRR